MGLLFNYLRLIARGGRQASRRAPSSPRRRLAFERCEARIALSTNDVTSASDATLHYEAADDKSAQWQLVGDGGMIALSFMATDVTSWRATIADRFDSGQLQGGRLGADLLSSGRLDAIKPLDSVNFAIRNDAMALLTNAIAHDALVGNVDLKAVGGLAEQGWSTPDEFDLFDSTSGGEYAMTLNDKELASGSANGDIAVIPPPTEQSGLNGGSEGGQIALSPFVAPTGLTLSDGQGSSSIARVGPARDPLGANATPPTNGSTRAEGLRGRAVVYEVADADAATALRSAKQLAERGDKSAEELIEEFELAASAALNVNGGGAIVRHQVERAADARQGEDGPLNKEAVVDGLFGSLSAALDLNGSASLAALSAVFTPSSSGEEANGREAAFTDWQALDSRDQQGLDDELAAPTAAGDRRMLGIGVAMALTVVPLRKAWRRRGASPAERQL